MKRRLLSIVFVAMLFAVLACTYEPPPPQLTAGANNATYEAGTMTTAAITATATATASSTSTPTATFTSSIVEVPMCPTSNICEVTP